MKPLHNRCLVRLIDNTKLTDFDGYAKGYTEVSRLTEPNQGVIEAVCDGAPFRVGDRIHFNSMLAVPVSDELSLVDNSAIFFVNDSLSRPGIIVEKHHVAQAEAGYIFREQDFFRVVTGRVVGSYVVVLPHSACRFYNNSREFFFVALHNILLEITDNISPGPNYTLIPEDSPLLFTKRMGSYESPSGTMSIVRNDRIYAQAA